MARRKPAFLLNREALRELDRATAEGLEKLALDVLEKVDPPDAAPFGEGLIEQGSYISYVDGKKVGGTASKKPKAMKVRGRGVVVGVGFGFPGRFIETGTVRQPARPFFLPVVIQVVGSGPAVANALKASLRDLLRKKTSRRARA